MKKLITAILCSLAFATASAQRVSPDAVPAAVKATFSKTFPTATGTVWEKEKDGGYEASFKQDWKRMTATFDAAGAWTETEHSISVASLPASVAQYLQAYKKGSRVKEAAILNMADGSTHYEAEVDGLDMVFDSTGKLLKTVKD